MQLEFTGWGFLTEKASPEVCIEKFHVWLFKTWTEKGKIPQDLEENNNCTIESYSGWTGHPQGHM